MGKLNDTSIDLSELTALESFTTLITGPRPDEAGVCYLYTASREKVSAQLANGWGWRLVVFGFEEDREGTPEFLASFFTDEGGKPCVLVQSIDGGETSMHPCWVDLRVGVTTERHEG